MAKYSESMKKAYMGERKSKKTNLPFGKWMVQKATKMKFGPDAKALYKMSDESKRNRGKMASSKTERP